MQSTTAACHLLFLIMIILSNTGETRGEEALNKIMEGGCSRDDVAVSQGASEPFPGGIPTYTVRVINVCTSGCSVSAIHLACGWFSTARTINPALFRRLAYNDCLVNDGKPLPVGAAVTFQYANIRPYPLSVSSVTCD